MRRTPRAKGRGASSVWQTLLFVMLLACAGIGMAREIETTASGTGDDDNAALADALARAVAQVNGVSSTMDVSTGKVAATGSGRETAGSKDGDTVTTREGRITVGRTPDARMQARGRVARYEVLDTQTLEDGRIRVTVKAFIQRQEAAVYDAPGSAAGRRRVAVFPGGSARSGYDFFGVADGNALARDLTARVESAVLDDRRLSVLDRSTLDATLIELGLVGSSLTGAAEKARLRQFRGADAIVLLEVRDAFHRVEHWRTRSTGQHRSAADTLLSVGLRVVVPATGEVLASREISVRQASGRDDALAQAADEVSSELALVLTGSAPPRRTRVEATEAVPLPGSEGPRRSGVSLPGDRR